MRFTQCEICFQLKKSISDAKSMEQRLGALVEYRSHLASQYADRALNWSLQECGGDEMADLIICQIDGMDQSKFRLPRDPQLRSTASLAKHIRPSLKVHALWIFGFLVIPKCSKICSKMFQSSFNPKIRYHCHVFQVHSIP